MYVNSPYEKFCNPLILFFKEPDPPTRRIEIRRDEGTQPWIIVVVALLLSGAVVAPGIVSLVVFLR